MKDTFKIIPIEKFNGLYSINTEGFVRNNKTNYIRSTNINRDGYLRLTIQDYGYNIHQLVALTFLGEPNGMQVNHIDHNKLNNDVSNLEYVSQIRNMEHSYNIRNNKNKKFNMPYDKIYCYKENELVKIYDNIKDTEKDGFRKTNVSDLVYGRNYTKTVKGFIFKGVNK